MPTNGEFGAFSADFLKDGVVERARAIDVGLTEEIVVVV